MPERNQVIYVTADSARWMRMDLPDGLIPPPTLALHQPLAGPVEFFYAECYRLPVPPEALTGKERREETMEAGNG